MVAIPLGSMNIGIVGAGLMGHGIALCFARADHDVKVYDALAPARELLPSRIATSMAEMGARQDEIDAAVARVAAVATLAECAAAAEFVIEAAPEKLALKQEIFAELERHAPPECVLATNTSAIPVSSIMAGIARQERAVGTHWWNPPHLIPLVEVVSTEWSKPEAVEATVGVLEEMGKTAVRVAKDIPGFVGNRLQHAMWREAIALVEEGVCDAEAIDNVVKMSFGRRLGVLGPLENADMIGVDLTLDIHNQILADLDRSTEPSPCLRKLVEDGQLGMKSGKGFRSWTAMEVQSVRSRLAKHLINWRA